MRRLPPLKSARRGWNPMHIFAKRHLNSLAATFAALALTSGVVLAAEEAPHIEKQNWTFSGLTGHFDKPQLRRGYTVYKNVCSACHGLRLLSYRNLNEPGGPEFSKETVDGIAAEAQVTELNDDGEPAERPGKASDRFVSPYPNDKAAAAAQNGAVPPDLSVIAKARSYERHAAWYMEPVLWAGDIFTNYQESGPDYIVALLMGYAPPPADMKMAPGMNYNKAFPGHQIAMPNPLSDGQVTYEDSTPGTVENYAKDVTAFLMWAAEPKLEERKRMGIKVLVYLLILAGLLYLSKRAIWRNTPH
jgi:ubiquinol-cytochrome c reductase cytochrome c1 subunit